MEGFRRPTHQMSEKIKTMADQIEVARVDSREMRSPMAMANIMQPPLGSASSLSEMLHSSRLQKD